MATELGLVSLTHLHKLAQSQDSQNQDQNLDQLNPNTITNIPTSSSTSTIIGSSSSTISNSWMWNHNKAHNHQQQPAEDDDSWEVRAFAEDTGNVMGTTWPPRSYTCAFCRREFRSAQALGGHMNVHRRDRARLHQVMPPNSMLNHPSSPAAVAAAASSSTTASSSFLIPTGEFVASGGGLCLLYQLPNPNGTYPCSPESPSPSPSTLLSVPQYPPHNFLRPSFSPSVNFPGVDNNAHRSRHDDHHPNVRPAEEVASESGNSGGDEGLDLELRLGHGPNPS